MSLKNNNNRNNLQFGQINWASCILFVIFLIFILSIIQPLMKGKSPFKLGLDLVGGTIVSYRTDFSTNLKSFEKLSEREILQICKQIIADRLQRKLHTVPDVYIRNDNQIVVNIPNVNNSQQVLKLVGQTYHLTMKIAVKKYKKNIPSKQLYARGDYYYELGKVAFSGEMLDLKSIKIIFDSVNQEPKVAFSFLDPYDKEFEKFTKLNKGKELFILLDNKVEVMGTIKDVINKEAVLSGNYTLEEAKDHAMLLRSGNLPVNLKVASLSGIGPTLGQEVKEAGIIAFLLTILLLLFIIVLAYYHRSWFLLAGLVSLFCLLISIVGIISIFRLTLDFSGIAGIILSIGMGMDAFIIIFESLEARLFKFTPKQISKYSTKIIQKIYSFKQEGRILFHANATTIITLILLYNTDRIRSLAIFILVGIVASIYTIFVTRQILQYTYHLAPNIGFSILGFIRGKKIGIFKLKKLYLTFSFLMGLISLLLVWNIFSGNSTIQLGSDFMPGTQITCEANNKEDFLNSFNKLTILFPHINIKYQKVKNPFIDNIYRYIISLPVKIQENNQQFLNEHNKTSDYNIQNNLTKEKDITIEGLTTTLSNNNVKLISIHSIDEKISSIRFISSFSILFGSFFLLAFYLIFCQNWINTLFSGGTQPDYFQKNSNIQVAIGIVVALIHDICVILIVIYLLNIKINLCVIAGIVTIFGYSVNDSVVIWSHIKNRAQKLFEEGIEKTNNEIVTESIDSILTRAILTTLSTMIPALSIFIVNISELKDFAWIIVTGTFSGTFSSIFIVGHFALKALEHKQVDEFDEDEDEDEDDTKFLSNEDFDKNFDAYIK